MERDSHWYFDQAGAVHHAGESKDSSSGTSFCPKALEPFCPHADDARDISIALDVIHIAGLLP